MQDVAGFGRPGGERRSRLRGRGVLKFRKVYLQICERWFPTPMHLKGAADLIAPRIPPGRDKNDITI